MGEVARGNMWKTGGIIDKKDATLRFLKSVVSHK